MSSNTPFNVAKFLYYNPELGAYSNIVTNQQAFSWATSNDITNMRWADDTIPSNFDAEVFISDYKNNVNISPLNAIIAAAMSNEGFSAAMLNNRAKYITTIYQNAQISASNIFQFNYATSHAPDMYYITSNALNVGDSVKLQNLANNVYDYATVDAIINSQTFRVSNPRKQYTGIGDTYRVVGIKVYDFIRLAKINFLRGLINNQVPVAALGYIDPEFNPDLYRLLYRETKDYSDVQAYYDYINHRDNGEKRIGRTSDLPLDSNVAIPNYDYLDVNYRLTLATDACFQWGGKILYGISQDDTTKSPALMENRDTIMTEWAIKKYIDRNYTELAVFNNVIVNGTSLFNGDVTFKGDLDVKDLYVRRDLDVGSNTKLNTLQVNGNAVYDGGFCVLRPSSNNTSSQSNNASNYIESAEFRDIRHTGSSLFQTDAMFDSNIFIKGYSLGPRIGIGPTVPVDYTPASSGIYDATLRNTVVKETLNVGSNLPSGSVAVNVNGFVIADNLNFVSDARTKTIIGSLHNDINPFHVLKTIIPVTYAYKDTPTVERVGFVADHIETVLPQAVNHIKEYLINNLAILTIATSQTSVSSANIEAFNVGDRIHFKETDTWHTISMPVTSNSIYFIEQVPRSFKEHGFLTIDKALLENVKSIDYPCLIATLWDAVRSILLTA